MAVIRKQYIYSQRNEPLRADQYQVTFIRETLRYLNSIFQGTVNNYHDSQIAATVFVQDLVNKMFSGEGVTDASTYMIKFPGSFYLIGYRSKLYDLFTKGRDGKKKRKLAFYDAMPLIFIFQKDNTGFTAINFHYLPPKHRAKLLQRIALYNPKKFFNNSYMWPMSWEILKRIVGPYRKKLLKYTVKRYLWSQLKKVKGAKIIRINNVDFISGCNYTSALWIGTTERKVLQMSMKLSTSGK